MTATYTLYARNSSRQLVATIDTFYEFEAILRFNDTSTWTLRMPGDAAAAAWLEIGIGAGLVVVRRTSPSDAGEVVLNGPVEINVLEQSPAGDVLEVTGIDDLGRLGFYLAMPDVADTNYHWVHQYDLEGPDNAETIIRTYVQNNAFLPLSPYRTAIPGATFAANSNLGLTISTRARFENLLDHIRDLAKLGGGLRFTMVQSGTDLVFDVTETADLTGTVRFSRDMGNLARATVHAQAPTVTFSYAGGGEGEGVLRNFEAVSDAGAVTTYGQREIWSDARGAKTTAEVQAKAQQQLNDGAAVTSVEMEPIDTDALAWGADWDLGDQVTVVVNETPIAGTISSVTLRIDENGATVTPVVSDPLAAERPSTLSRTPSLRTIGQRVGMLERNDEPPTLGSIWLWSRAASDIPSNWVVCDGTNGTYDMRDKFALGAGGAIGGTQGNSGGASTANLQHSHTVNNHTHGMNNHVHTLSNHDHTFSDSGTTDTENQAPDTITGGGGQAAQDNHDHDFSVSGTTSGPSVANTGGNSDQTEGASPGTNNALSTTQSIMPPWRALHYIQRVFTE